MVSPKNIQITPVILSGGAGSRLWPMSRAGYPKQFLPLTGEMTMIQETVLRVSDSRFARPLVICNEEHRFIIAEQLRSCNCETLEIILEPFGRNTAPAVAVAALRLLAEYDDDGLMLVLPSDHAIADQEGFLAACDDAAEAALEGALVTFGITPSRAETGYGYIKAAEPFHGHTSIRRVERFVEKPDQAKAEAYVTDGAYHWNSGIFLFSAKSYLEELEEKNAAIVEASRKALEYSQHDLTFCRLNADAFAASPADSVDYAVMEKTQKAAVVPVELGWNDLGSWAALWEMGEKDARGNVAKGDVIFHDTSNAYVQSDHGLVAVAGVKDLVVVVTDDAVLVADQAKTQDVKRIVERLKSEERSEYNLHTTVHRPWGSYRGIDRGERFQVKRIVVQPGEQLSLQMHHHRAEHWIVVSGTATVTCGKKTFMLTENQSTYIPSGELHRLENPGKVPLHLIEVQSGSYLGEDDIVRFEDGYGRTAETLKN